MLIKGGLIHTMTEQGCFVGELLVREDRIAAVGKGLSVQAPGCILDASGLTILPGLIDIHMHDGPDLNAAFLRSKHVSGVTCGIMWPEQGGPCRCLTSDGFRESAIYAVHPETSTETQLTERIRDLAEKEYRIACEIHGPEECRMMLRVLACTNIKATLIHLTRCEDLLEDVVSSGCPVVLGVDHLRSGNPWDMACRLDQLGTTVALTCNHPTARLCHLPLCGALCVREGMDRERALRMMTTATAAISGLSDRGVIRAGARADLAIYDGDPLLLSTSHVMTIAGGKIRH